MATRAVIGGRNPLFNRGTPPTSCPVPGANDARGWDVVILFSIEEHLQLQKDIQQEKMAYAGRNPLFNRGTPPTTRPTGRSWAAAPSRRS